MDICVVGGGISGLGLAGFLHQQGMNPVVVEQAEEWDRVGWGIGLWGTGVDVLKELGVAETALDHGTGMDTYHLRKRGGKKIASYSVDTGDDLRFLAIHRADLHNALREAVPDDSIRMGTTPEQLTETDDGVEIVFDDGMEERFDLVVGADGVHSTVRSQCFDDYTVTEKDIAVWSFWTPPEIKVPEGTTSIWTAGTEAFLTDINGNGLVNIATHTKKNETVEPPARELLEETAEIIGWNLPDMVEAVDDEAVFCDTIKTVKAKNWTTDRIVLIGDAAHAVNPIVGMGASLALEDAYVLADELTGAQEPLSEILSRYEQRRRKPVKSLQQRARIMEYIVFMPYPIFSIPGTFLMKHTQSLAERYYQRMSTKNGLESL